MLSGAKCWLGVAAVVLFAAGRVEAQQAGSLADREAALAKVEEAKGRAKVHFERGIAAYKEGRYKDAIDAFLDGHREFPSPVLSFNAARAYDKMGDSAGALRFYREYLRQSPDAADRAQVEPRVGELESKLQSRGVQQVTVLTVPDGGTVIIDDRPVGVTPWTGEILPGRHELRVRLQGYEEASRSFELPAHRALDVSVLLTPARTEAPNKSGGTPEPSDPGAPAPEPGEAGGIGIATWVTLGVGTAALGGALVFEVLRAQSEQDVRDEPRQVDKKEALDTMESRQTTARVLAGVGSAAIVIGGVLLFLDLSRDGGTQVGLGCDGTGCAARLGGRW
jgi:tetratricopeptide (TPR) repeat protein